MKISKTELKEVIREAISEVVLDEKFSLGGAYEKMIQKEMDRIAKNALGLVTQQIAKKYKVGKPSPVEKGTKVTKRLVSTMIGNGMKELRNKAHGPNLKKAYQKLIDKIDKDTQKYKKLGEGKKITLGDKGRKFTLDIENEAQMFLARLKKDKKKLTPKNFSDYIDAEYKFFNTPKLNQQVFNYIKKNLKSLSEVVNHTMARFLYVPKKDIKKAIKVVKSMPFKLRGKVEVDSKPATKVKGFYRITTEKQLFNAVVEYLATADIGVKTISKGKM